ATVASRRRPELVLSLAAELSRRGKLIDLGPLLRAETGDDSEPAGNSAFRLRQVFGSFELSELQQSWLAHASGPVLLVDDLVDSRWTLTVAARQLRLGGAPSVLPFALAAVG
ncbi:MAG: recombinase RecQ, partial [Propionicimonas sp.]